MLRNIKIILLLNIGLVVLTSLYGFFIQDKISDIVPVHFNLYGQPDLFSYFDESMLYFFPLLSILIVVSMIFLFYHPELASLPHTLFFMLLPLNIREEAYMITRRYTIKILTLANLIFVYLYTEILNIWIGVSQNINIYVLISFLVALLLIIVLYIHNVKVLVSYHLDYHHEHNKN